MRHGIGAFLYNKSNKMRSYDNYCWLFIFSICSSVMPVKSIICESGSPASSIFWAMVRLVWHKFRWQVFDALYLLIITEWQQCVKQADFYMAKDDCLRDTVRLF